MHISTQFHCNPMATATTLPGVMPWHSVPTNREQRDIKYPQTSVDSDYSNFINTLRSNLHSQDAEMIERQHRMAEHAKHSEVTRQLKILSSVQADREPTPDDKIGRRPGWLQQATQQRVSRPGDVDEPVRFTPADDVDNRGKFTKERRLANASVNSRFLYKNDQAVADSQDDSDRYRTPGLKNPIFTRMPYQSINQPNIEPETPGANRSTNTAALWRSAKDTLPTRSDGIQVDNTGPAQYTSMNNSRKGNMAIIPSFVLRDDDTGEFGLKSGTGGVSQVTKSQYVRGVATDLRNDSSVEVAPTPSFILVPGNTTARRDLDITFRDDSDNAVPDTMAQLNTVPGTNKQARVRTDTYTFADDSKQILEDPNRPNASNKQKAGAVVGGAKFKNDASIDTDSAGQKRGQHDLTFKTSKTIDKDLKLSMLNEDLDQSLYVKGHGMAHKIAKTDERPDVPEQTKTGKDGVDTESQRVTSNMRPVGFDGGRNTLEDRSDTRPSKYNVTAPLHASMSIGARAVGLSAAPVHPETHPVKDQPTANRELIRASSNVNGRVKGQDVGFQIPQTQALGVAPDMHGRAVLPDTSTIVERTEFVPVPDPSETGVPMPDRVALGNTKTMRDLLLEKRAVEIAYP